MRVGEKLLIESLEVELRSPAELKLSGTLVTPTAQADFRRLLQDLHTQLVSTRVPAMAVDVQALGFLNASALRAFVDWVARAAHAGYTLAFKTAAGVAWQRLTFSVLKSLAPGSVELVEGASHGPS